MIVTAMRPKITIMLLKRGLKYPNLTEIEVAGDGLSEQDWLGFEKVKISYQTPKLTTGLVDVTWNKKINLGGTLTFSGRVQTSLVQTERDKLMIVKLFDPAGDKVDEEKIRADDYFSLSP